MSDFVIVVKFTAIDFNLEGDILVFVRSNRPSMTVMLLGLYHGRQYRFLIRQKRTLQGKEKTLQEGLFYCRKIYRYSFSFRISQLSF